MLLSTGLGRTENEGGEIGVAALTARGLGNTQQAAVRDHSWEPPKEAVKYSHWPQMQLLLGPVDIQEKHLANTQDILEKIPRVLSTDYCRNYSFNAYNNSCLKSVCISRKCLGSFLICFPV